MSPTGDRPPPGSPEAWIAHALSDLKMARAVLDREDILPEHICFHAQQAAEKALKAVLIARGIDFPLIHDIEELLGIGARAGLDVPGEIAEAGILTPYAVPARYPGYWEKITPAVVDEAIRIAASVVSWAVERVGDRGSQT